jgi:DNA polymerase-3 subunit gamma/tau
LKFIVQKRIILEVELIKLCHPEVDVTNEGLLERVVALEEKIKKGVQVVAKNIEQMPMVEDKLVEKKIYQEALPAEIETAMQDFIKVIEQSEHPVKAMLNHTTRAYLGDGPIYIICPSETIKNTLKEKENHDRIVEVLGSIHKRKFELDIVTEDEFGHMAHDVKQTTTGVEEAKDMQAQILAKINFDQIEQI